MQGEKTVSSSVKAQAGEKTKKGGKGGKKVKKKMQIGSR